MMHYFGKRYDAPIFNDIREAPTPDGAVCFFCEESIVYGEDGFYDAGGSVLHRECFLIGIIGSVAHQQRVCSCFGGVDAPSEQTPRQAAKAALAYSERKWNT